MTGAEAPFSTCGFEILIAFAIRIATFCPSRCNLRPAERRAAS